MSNPEGNVSALESMGDVARQAEAGMRIPLAAKVITAVAAGAYAASSATTRKLWPSTESEIIPFDGDDTGFVSERWLLMPGHGQHRPQQMAQELMANGLAGQKLSSFQYAGKFDLAEMAPKLHAFGQTTDVINVFGNSLGTLTFLETWRAMSREQKKAFPRLGKIALNSCPLDVSDTYDGNIAKVVSRIPYRGGVVGKLLLGSIDRVREKHANFEEVKSSIHKAWQAMGDGQSSPTWIGQTRFLARTDRDNVLDHARGFEGLITQETCAAYFMPEDEGRDKTVIDRKAFERWMMFFAKFGVDLDKILLPNAAHADVPRASEQLGGWIAKVSELQSPETFVRAAN